MKNFFKTSKRFFVMLLITSNLFLFGLPIASCSGGGATGAPAEKPMVIDAKVNEIRFYGDSGDGVEEVVSIGIKPVGGDIVIGYFKASGSYIPLYALSDTNNAVYAVALGADVAAVFGYNSSGTGVYGSGDIGVYGHAAGSYNVGGYFEGPAIGGAPIILAPSGSASAPTHSAALGSLWVTSAGVLYINTSGSTTWQKVGAQ